MKGKTANPNRSFERTVLGNTVRSFMKKKIKSVSSCVNWENGIYYISFDRNLEINLV